MRVEPSGWHWLRNAFRDREFSKEAPDASPGTMEDAMTKMPPVPPENRTRKGPGGENPTALKTGPDRKEAERRRHLGEQGHQGNIKQNTTNQGYQQDR